MHSRGRAMGRRNDQEMRRRDKEGEARREIAKEEGEDEEEIEHEEKR